MVTGSNPVSTANKEVPIMIQLNDLSEILKYCIENKNQFTYTIYAYRAIYEILDTNIELHLGFNWPDNQKYILVYVNEIEYSTICDSSFSLLDGRDYPLIIDEDELFNERLGNTEFHNLSTTDMQNMIDLRNYMIQKYNSEKI